MLQTFTRFQFLLYKLLDNMKSDKAQKLSVSVSTHSNFVNILAI